MSSWIFLALAAPALYAINNFIDRFLVEKRIKNAGVLTIFTGAGMLAIGVLTLSFVRFPALPFGQVVLLLISGALIGISMFPYYAAIAIDDTSRVVPFFQTIPIFVLLLSYIFLREIPLTRQFIGMGGIIIGAFLLSVKEFDWNLFRPRPSVWYILLSSFCIAVSFVLFRFVVSQQDFWPSLGYNFAAEGLGGMLLLLLPKYRLNSFQELKNANVGVVAIFGANQAIYAVGRFFSHKVISLAPVALASAFGGVQPFFVLFFGIILSVWFPQIIKEDTRRSAMAVKISAIILIFAGAWFVN